MRSWPLVSRRAPPPQLVPLLLEHERRAGGTGCRQQGQPLDPVLPTCSQQSDPAAFAVPRGDDTVPVDIVAPLQMPHHHAHVLGVVFERRRFGPAAALPEAALVVTRDDESAVGEGPGELAEDGHAGNVLVPVDRPGTGHQHHGRPAAVGRRGHVHGGDHRGRQAEPGRPDPYALAAGVWWIGGQPCRDRCDVAAGNLQRGVGQADPQQPVVLVDPHLGFERLTGVDERDAVGPRLDDPFGGLDVLDADPVDPRRQVASRRHVDRQLVARLRPPQADGQRLVADEDRVGQQDRRGIDAIAGRGLPVAFPQDVRDGAVREGALEAERNARPGTFEGEPAGAPIRVVRGLEDPRVGRDGRRHLPARLHEPPVVVVRPDHAHPLEAGGRRSDEDVEERFARPRVGGRLRPGDARGHRHQRRTGGQAHALKKLPHESQHIIQQP